MQPQKRKVHKPHVYLVVDCTNAPGRVYAVFADEEAAIDFRNHYHEDEANVEPRGLYYGQQISMTGYLE